eukprot:gene9611-11304_t
MEFFTSSTVNKSSSSADTIVLKVQYKGDKSFTIEGGFKITKSDKLFTMGGEGGYSASSEEVADAFAAQIEGSELFTKEEESSDRVVYTAN